MPDINILAHRSGEALRQVIQGESYGTTLLVLFCDLLGDESSLDKPLLGLHWHPQTIREYLEEHSGGKMPPDNLDRLMAAISIVTTDLFFTSLDGFIKLCNTLCGESFNPAQFSMADSVECAWGCTEALLLHPPDQGEEPFSSDIRHYIAEVLKEEGYMRPPDILRLAIGGDHSAQVNHDYADDHETMQGILAVQQAKTAEVETEVREGLLELIRQLQALPLRHGSAAELEKRISALTQKE